MAGRKMGSLGWFGELAGVYCIDYKEPTVFFLLFCDCFVVFIVFFLHT